LFFPDAPHPAAPPSPAPASEGIAFEAERKSVFIRVHPWLERQKLKYEMLKAEINTLILGFPVLLGRHHPG
jgi:hypothetical protein